MDREEFALRVSARRNQLYRTAYLYLGREADALEAVDETVYRALRRLKQLQTPALFETWITRILINACHNELRRRKRFHPGGDDALPEPRGAPGSDADDPAQSVADRAGAAELETLVRGLREPYGRIAVLYFLEHRETAEIAKLVGRPPATVNSQLWRAKLLLRQQITERRQKE